MNFIELGKQIQSEVDKYNEGLAKAAKDLEVEADKLTERGKELDAKELSLKKQEASLKPYTEAENLSESLKSREEAVSLSEVANKKEALRLRKWENELAEIEKRQAEEKTALAEAQTALSEDKATYKEKLQAEFVEQLKKKL